MPMFQKRHYIAIASVLADRRASLHNTGTVAVHDDTIRAMADMLENDNPNFDHAHFCAVAMGAKPATSRPPRY